MEYYPPPDRLLAMSSVFLALSLASMTRAAPMPPMGPVDSPRPGPSPTARPIEPRQAFTPRRPESVVAGSGAQLQPNACLISGGTTLLVFERLQTATLRRIYVKRRRPGFPWSFGQMVPLPKGAYSMQHGSLLCRTGKEVLMYAQAGDLRHRRARVHVFQSQGDSLVFHAGRALTLGLPADAALTEPFAALSEGGGEVLLTVSRRFSDATEKGRNGCYLARSPDGRVFPGAAVFLGPGERCRTVSLGPRRLLLTYQRRASLREPWQAFFRLSRDDGASFGLEARVAQLRESFDAHPAPSPMGAAAIYHVARMGEGTALFVTRLNPSGAPVGVRRLTLLQNARVLGPFALPQPGGDLLFFAREVKPLDFDVLSGKVSR